MLVVWFKLQTSHSKALHETLYRVCGVIAVFDCDYMFFKMLKSIRHMGKLCCWGTDLSLWILNNFSYLGYDVEPTEKKKKSFSAYQTIISDCMFVFFFFSQGELNQNIISKLDRKSVLFSWDPERGILYSYFCITGFVFAELTKNHWLPK